MGQSRSLWLLGFLALSAIVFTCSRDNMIIIHGQQHDYHIPQSYDASDSNMIVYGSRIIGADSSEQQAYLRFSHKQMTMPELGSEWELKWLLFWGNDYGKRFQTATKAILENAKRMGLVAGFYHYHKMVGLDTTYDYYVSFNPESSSGKWETGDYYIEMTKIKPFKIGDEITIPKAGCTLYTIHDGISTRVTVFDDLCEINRFPVLYQSVVHIMESWKKKKPQR